MKRTKHLVVILMLMSLAGGLWGPAATQAAAPPADFVPGVDFVPAEVVVQYRAGTGDTQQRAARGRVNAQPKETLRRQASGAPSLELAVLPAGASVFAVIATLQNDPAVQFAEPNWIYTHGATSNDKYYADGSLWGMYGETSSDTIPQINEYGSQAAEAWAVDATGRKDVYIGVIDEGIQFTHPDLDANIWTNSREVPANGVDDDGNGYVDDIHGWDFDGKDNTIYDGGTQGRIDDHGTHVAGTIGAEGNNGIGVAGVNWNVTYISGKFLGRRGGTLANAVLAVDYMTNLKMQQGLNIVALNNSWGGGGYSQALHDAIIRAARVNILFIAAAGNDGTDNDLQVRYPSAYNTSTGTTTSGGGAGYDAVIAVAAIDKSGALASFSNYGKTTVDLGAPGVGVWSTTAYNTYSSYSGTSMATPHVTGAAALYASVNPGANGQEIRTALLNTATKRLTPALNGKTVTNGRLDISCLQYPTVKDGLVVKVALGTCK